jgi:hypothetical protein
MKELCEYRTAQMIFAADIHDILAKSFMLAIFGRILRRIDKIEKQ